MGEMRWRTAKMSWSPESPLELVGEPQRCLFQRDFACSVLHANRLTRIVCKASSVSGATERVAMAILRAVVDQGLAVGASQRLVEQQAMHAVSGFLLYKK